MTYFYSRISTRILPGLVFVVLFSMPQNSPAQTYPGEGQTLTTIFRNPLTQLRQRLSQSALSSALLPMEGAVDPKEYIVGPGDLFSVSIGVLEQSASVPLTVGADGRLMLPDAGPVEVGGLTLEEARVIALERLKQSYENTPVDLVLTQPRQFYVHVSGAVPAPGRYLALPVSRVSSVLEVVFADTTHASVSNVDYRPSLRNIRITRSNGKDLSADLIQYFSSGDVTFNPYLSDGDVIHVPAYDPSFSSIYIGGAVPFPGSYDFRDGDTLKDLIRLAGGLGNPAEVADIRVFRMEPDGGSTTRSFSVEEYSEGNAGVYKLQVRDEITVRRAQILGAASVEGWVTHPGTYPISDGVTTLSELLDYAGGLRADALIQGAYLIRKSLPVPRPPNKYDAFSSPGSELAALLRSDSTEILRRLRLTDMDFLSRFYFAQEIRLQNRVSMNLATVLSGDAAPVRLRDGDRVLVPRDDHTVRVFGQVVRPGYVPYTPGKPASFYVDAAGGLGIFASDQYLIRVGGDTFERVSDQSVRSGDMIFIDRRVDIAPDAETQRLLVEEARVKSDVKIRTLQAVLQTVATIASFVTLIVTVRRK